MLLVSLPDWPGAVPRLSCCSHQGQLRAPEPDQLEQVVAGSDQVPPRIDLFHAPELEAAQAPGLFDLAVDWLDDGLTQGIDRLFGFRSELAVYAGFGIGLSGQTPSFGRWRLAMRQSARREVGIDAALLAVLRVGFAAVARIECHHYR